MESERQAFLNAIEAGPWDDELTRGVFADWLDDRGEHEEADRQRQWVPSSRWLRELAARHYTGYDEGRPFEYEEILQAGHEYIDHDGYLVQYDGQSLQDEIYGNSKEFWRHWSIVTGRALPAKNRWGRDFTDSQPFSCSC